MNCYTPGISAMNLVDDVTCTRVDPRVECRIHPGSKDRHGRRVRIHCPYLLSRELIPTYSIMNLVNFSAKEHKVLRSWFGQAGQRECHELERMMNGGKDELFVLK